jgi:hypothetical protein
VGEAVESGLGVFAGTADADDRSTAQAVIDLWRRIGLPDKQLSELVVVTPSCGLAGASLAGAREALARCRRAARLIPELIEEGVG